LVVKTRIVIRRATLVDRPAGATTLVIEDRRIVRISADEESQALPGDWEVDAAGRMVVPGGVDAHTHLAAGALLRRASLPDRHPTSVTDLRSFRGPLENRLQPDDVEALAAAGALAALRSGVTCALDLCRAAPGCEGEALAAEGRAISGVGLRAAIAYAIDPARTAQGIAAVEGFAAGLGEGTPLRAMLGLDGLDGTTVEGLASMAQSASRLGLHASIGEDDNDLAHAYNVATLRPVHLLGSSALLGSRSLVAHGGTLGSTEVTLLGRTGTSLAVTPRAALLWRCALPSGDLLAAREAAVMLGTDGQFADLAGEALALSLYLRRTPSQRPLGDLVGRAIWPNATGLASRLFGEKIGVLEEGAVADVVVLDWRPPFPLPEASEGDIAQLWVGAPAAWAIVDGRVRLREGRLLGADEAEIAQRARQVAQRLLA
jgi:cytosine/adenosine deaminase-related metal-dependent hydrolase